MWYEVLPSIGVIFGAMCIGGAAMSFVPNMLLGKVLDFGYFFFSNKSCNWLLKKTKFTNFL